MRVAPKNYTPSHNNKTNGESHVDTSMDSPLVSLRKHPTTKREMMHRHWYMGVTATVLTMRMTTPHQQDKDTM